LVVVAVVVICMLHAIICNCHGVLL